MWPDDFIRCKDEFQDDRVCIVKGIVERTREEPGLVLSRILSVPQAKQELTKWLRLSLNLEVHNPDAIEQLARVLQGSPGSCPVYLDIRDAAGRRCRLKAGESYRVNPWTHLTAELEMILGPGRVEFYAHANGNGRNGKSGTGPAIAG
jgi:DNA polymerase III alpha subunit